MLRIQKTVYAAAAIVLFTSLALAQKPNFSPAIYADGRPWGTKGLKPLPAPNEHMHRSFDKLFIVTNGAGGQLPVAEAAPGNPDYNGGRWFTHTVTWTWEAGEALVEIPVLLSYGDIQFHLTLGHLTVEPGSPMGGPPPYFECPLLPVK